MEKDQVQVETTEKSEYLKALAAEVLADKEWDFPESCRFFLAADLEWTLLAM